jgi:hypothetical protein
LVKTASEDSPTPLNHLFQDASRDFGYLDDEFDEFLGFWLKTT